MIIRTFRMKSVQLASALVLSLAAAPGCSSGDAKAPDDGAATGGAATGGAATGGTGGGTETGGTGAGGTGGTPTVTSVCDETNTVPAEAGVIAPGESVEKEGWDAYQSTPDADKLTGAMGEDGKIDTPGADGTGSAYHYAGTGWATYGAGININLFGCKSLANITGVKFKAKGFIKAVAGQEKPPSITENALNFRVITPGAHGQILQDGVNVGGDCDTSKPGCFMPPQTYVTLDADPTKWTDFDVKLTDLKVPSGAAPHSALNDSKTAMLLGWHSDGGDFDIWIDDVEFY